MASDIAQLENLASDLLKAVQSYKEQAPGKESDLLHRRKISEAAQLIVRATETPEEQWCQQSVNMAEMGAIRCFMKWGLFDIIPLPGKGTITYKELADKIGAEEELITRMAWIMVSTGTLSQIGTDSITHTRLSTVYANRHPSGMMFQVMYDEGNLVYTRWVDFFSTHPLTIPTGPKKNIYTFANGRYEDDVWNIMHSNPQRLGDFAQGLNTLEQLLPITGFYDFGWVAEKARESPERTLLVDVGGGKGQATIAITKENPGIERARCVLQDRREVVEVAEQINDPGLEGVKKMAHDFWTEQPVKGAVAYYVRRCLHDYPDHLCVDLLRQLADAAAPDSKVLMVEQIMTNPPSPLSAQTDLCMMNIGGKERNEQNFRDLAKASGLKVLGIYKAHGTEMGIIECAKAS